MILVVKLLARFLLRLMELPPGPAIGDQQNLVLLAIGSYK